MISKRKSFRMFAASLVAVFFVGALPWRELKADANTHGEYELSPLSVVYDQTSSWGTTTQGEFVITNSSEETVESWTLEIEYAADLQISNLWNGQDLSNEATPANILVIGNEVYNASIAPGATVSFGLIVMGTEITPVAPLSISIYSEDEQIEEVEPTEETTEETDVTENEVTPTVSPTATPSVTPTAAPTEDLTATPTVTPTTEPTATPTPVEEEPEEEPEETEEEIDPTLDSDGDEIPDVQEIEIGTNPNDPDSDGDGLDDYLEVIVEYDPRLVDSDADGILDGNEDLDNDGISNINEVIIGTRLFIEDCDYDGLLDGEEVDVYGTDPMNPDSDGDGIGDSDEIAIGKDPLNPADSTILIEQTKIEEFSNTDDAAISSVEVTMDLSNSINYSLSVEDVYNTDVYCTNVAGRIGSPISFECRESLDTASVKIHYDEAALGDTNEADLGVLWYDEANCCFVEQGQAIIDSSNNTVSLELEHFSRYVLVDLSVWRSTAPVAYSYEDLGATSSERRNMDVVIALNMEQLTTNEYQIEAIESINTILDMLGEGDRYSFVVYGDDSVYSNNEFYSAGSDNEIPGDVMTQIHNFHGVSYAENARIRRQSVYVDVGNDTLTVSIGANPRQLQSMYHPTMYNAGAAGVGATTWFAYASAGFYMGQIYGYNVNSLLDNTEFYRSVRSLLGLDTYADEDGDGLPDALEILGMLGSNGSVYYSDPNNADTDGDGLSDGEEMGLMYMVRRHSDDLVDVQGEMLDCSTLAGYGSGFLQNCIPENIDDRCFLFCAHSDPGNPDEDGDNVLDSVDTKAFQRNEEIDYIIFGDQDLLTWRKVNYYINEYAFHLRNFHCYYIDSSETFSEFIGTMDRKRDSMWYGLSFDVNDVTSYDTYSSVSNLLIIADGDVGYMYFDDEEMSLASILDVMNNNPGIPCDIQNVDLQVNYLANALPGGYYGLEGYEGFTTAEMFFCYNGEHVVQNVYAWNGETTFISLDVYFRFGVSTPGTSDDAGYYHYLWNDGNITEERVGSIDLIGRHF